MIDLESHSPVKPLKRAEQEEERKELTSLERQLLFEYAQDEVGGSFGSFIVQREEKEAASLAPLLSPAATGLLIPPDDGLDRSLSKKATTTTPMEDTQIPDDWSPPAGAKLGSSPSGTLYLFDDLFDDSQAA